MEEKIVIKYDKNKKVSEYNTLEGLGNKYFECLGIITFFYRNNNIQYFKNKIEENIPNSIKKNGNEELDIYMNFIKKHNYQDWIADMMDGKEFLESVDNGCIIDYDGILSEIYIDGFRSNLGLFHEGFCQGNFLVDSETFKNICENHHVLVNWANK